MAPSASRGACAEPCPLEGNHVQVPGVTGDILSKDNTLDGMLRDCTSWRDEK